MSFIIGIFAVIGVLTTAVAIAMGIVAAFDTRALRRKPTELEQRRALVEALRLDDALRADERGLSFQFRIPRDGGAS